MNVWRRLRHRLSRVLLRGWILDWWLGRKMRRVESRYAAELVRASTGKPAAERLPGLKAPTPLRRILFISDIMWEDRELVPELEKICTVATVNLRPVLRETPEGRAPRDVVVTALRNLVASQDTPEPDAILFYARPSLLSEEAFGLLRKRWKCPLLGLNLDEKIEFLRYGVFASANDDYGRWAARFDLNLTNVRAVMDWYGDRGLPVHYMPEGFHPKFSGPPVTAPPNYRYDLSFVGTKRPERESLILRLRALGLPVTPLGFGWPDSSAGSRPEEVYRSSLMNLGIGFASPSQTLTTLKTRDFECPGAGACYLTTWNWELAIHFEIGRDILCYRSEEELVEIFSYYRRRPEECAKIAVSAWHRCLAGHTWEKRFRDLFRKLGWLA
jgi:hypothetical protein